MTEPQSIAKLATALALAQAEFKPIVKDKVVTTGTYKYRYADLASVRDAVTPSLAKNGLAIVQTFRPNGGVHQYVDTLLVHSSGESISSSYQIPATGKQQEIGSAITYARRYSLCAILGVVAEDDDDGNAADQKQVKVEQTVSTQAAGKLENIAKAEDVFPLVDQDGVITNYKLGMDWITQCEIALQSANDKDACWNANSASFYRVQEKVTAAKHKGGMDRCSRLVALVQKLTKAPELKP